MEYVGHGAFGIIGKKAWLPYFGVLGISEHVAWKIMPVIGAVDISLGLSALVWPCRATALYMTVWGFWTALLRPLSGEPVWEALERAGNFGIPFALLVVSEHLRWFERTRPLVLNAPSRPQLRGIFRITTATLLIGHGAFGAVVGKPQLTHQLQVMGLGNVPLAAWGGFELALGLGILLGTAGWLPLFVFFWKMATELAYPLSGAPIWEFVERGGSYAAPLALFLVDRETNPQTSLHQNPNPGRKRNLRSVPPMPGVAPNIQPAKL